MSRVYVPWYQRKEIVETYESWYQGPEGERMDRLEKATLRALLEPMQPKSLLEVGSGTAHFTRWFASELGLKTVGVDLSSLMLTEARKYWDGPLVQADAAALPFRDRSFDVVAFITSFEYMPDPVRVLREAGRVARTGILLGLMNRWSAATVRRRVQELFGKTPFFGNAHFYSLPEIKKLLQRALGDRITEIRWQSTLFPKGFPWQTARLPFGNFLALAVHLREVPHG
ncbi:MAG: class I SAM-dependent methyltransferase [Candidatus Bipolaricaulota bacterium]|nr:class I SAM-dependent methyltransferase [Candidatus Bipolaricaulota bacterium]MCX8103313.1 class I SAM-dependent methyltransferase [Candidatus Bipolaricaulota bacterium]MDW8031875.1 class I SAM-dependent methyltransferase [Candidatus Bipolaricaulota bacterium]